MAMTTIYVPDGVKARLERHPEINVSRVCRAALEAEIDRREPDAADLRRRLLLAEPSGWAPDATPR